ncbi:hypothetical protein [Candidatus Poriferisodalis sp.]|uniref:hypothetical protein n=1 Tax=Candidatus Poriferisodalis sp. TaxID=3101277 RepID=UPI003B5B97B4
MNRTDDETGIAGGTDSDTIAPTLAAFENSQIRLAIGYSDGGITCNECGYGRNPNPASLRVCWVSSDDEDAENVDVCDCHFSLYLEGAIGDAFPLEDD